MPRSKSKNYQLFHHHLGPQAHSRIGNTGMYIVLGGWGRPNQTNRHCVAWFMHFARSLNGTLMQRHRRRSSPGILETTAPHLISDVAATVQSQLWNTAAQVPESSPHKMRNTRQNHRQYRMPARPYTFTSQAKISIIEQLWYKGRVYTTMIILCFTRTIACIQSTKRVQLQKVQLYGSLRSHDAFNGLLADPSHGRLWSIHLQWVCWASSGHLLWWWMHGAGPGDFILGNGIMSNHTSIGTPSSAPRVRIFASPVW